MERWLSKDGRTRAHGPCRLCLAAASRSLVMRLVRTYAAQASKGTYRASAGSYQVGRQGACHRDCSIRKNKLGLLGPRTAKWTDGALQSVSTLRDQIAAVLL